METTTTAAPAPGSSSSGLFDKLSAVLLREVLVRVPQTERLALAGVSSAWQNAAVLAMQHITCNLSPYNIEPFASWLQQHGGRVESLVVAVKTRLDPIQEPPISLPWPKLSALQDLDLTKCSLPRITPAGSSSHSVSAGSGDSSSNSPAASPAPLLPALKHLRLSGCALESAESLLRLATSPGLTTFEAFGCTFNDEFLFLGEILISPDDDYYDELLAQQRRNSAVVCRMLQQLQQLQQLTLLRGSRALGAAAFAHIASMQRLQHLNVHVCVHDAGSAPPVLALPSSLTYLQISSRAGAGAPTLPPPVLQPLSTLRHLELGGGCSLLPSALGSLTALQVMRLTECALLPANGQPAAVVLLRALPQLACLHTLALSDIAWDVPADSLHLFSGLTASPQLATLALTACDSQPLPQGAIEHMFVAGRQLPELRDLNISAEDVFGWEPAGWCIDSQGLFGICSCCPAIERLVIRGVVDPGATDMSPLQQLECCYTLEVGGGAFTDAVAATVASGMKQLGRLSITHSPGFTYLGLEHLTALQITSLQVSKCGSQLHDRLSIEHGSGTVSEQIREMCDKSMVCWRARAQRSEAEVTRLQQQVQTLQQELADAQAQLAAGGADAVV